MARLFFSLTLFLLGYTAVAIYTIYYVSYEIAGDILEADVERDMLGFQIVIDGLIRPGMSYAEVDAVMKKATEQSNLNLVLRKLIDYEGTISDTKYQMLANDQPAAIDIPEEIIGMPISNTGWVIELGPTDTIPSGEMLENVLLWVLFADLLLTVFIWAWWLQRKINRINITAESFGKGDLNARAPTKNSRVLGNLNRAFNDMAQRIQSLINGHKLLVNAVSHELRSPITRLRLQLDMLSDENLTQQQQVYVAGINDDVDELDELVDEMLTYAKLERSEPGMQLNAISISELCEQALPQLQRESEMQMSWTLSADDKVRADQRYIRRAINNLIRNAFNYAHSQVHIETHIEPDALLLIIEDDGPGIPVPMRANLFEPFARIDKSRDRESGGWGLGLAIVHQIVRWHQGKIEIQDSALGGAKFVIRLPLAD